MSSNRPPSVSIAERPRPIMAPHLYEGNTFDQDGFHQQSSSLENKDFLRENNDFFLYEFPVLLFVMLSIQKLFKVQDISRKVWTSDFWKNNNRKCILRIWNGAGKSRSGNEIKNENTTRTHLRM